MRYHAYSATCTLNTRVTQPKETSRVTFIFYTRARRENRHTHTTTMQSSMLSSTCLSPPRFSTSFSKRGQNTTRRQNKHNLRVYAKDFPKPEQIDKTENYRIAGDLSKRFAVRRPFSMSERIILSVCRSFSFLSFLRRQPRISAVMVSLLFLREC